ETALHVTPKSLERGRAVVLIGRAQRLKRVDADLVRRVHVPAWLGEQRRHVAACAAGLAAEQRSTAACGCGVEGAAGRSRRPQAQLIVMQRGKLRGDQVGDV